MTPNAGDGERWSVVTTTHDSGCWIYLPSGDCTCGNAHSVEEVHHADGRVSIVNRTKGATSNAEKVRPGQRPILDFDERVQDLGDVLYDLRPQAPYERYVDYAQRLLDALGAAGWTITPPPNDKSGT